MVHQNRMDQKTKRKKQKKRRHNAVFYSEVITLVKFFITLELDIQ